MAHDVDPRASFVLLVVCIVLVFIPHYATLCCGVIGLCLWFGLVFVYSNPASWILWDALRATPGVWSKNIAWPARVLLFRARRASLLAARRLAPTWASALGRKTGATEQPARVTQLESVAQLLLAHYLAPSDILALWRTNRALALAVWQHAPTVRLSLTGSLARAWPWCLGAKKDAPLPAKLASSRPPTFIPQGATCQRITSLTLNGMRLSVDELRALQLPHLRALALEGCELAASTAHPPPPMLTLSSLECTGCRPAPTLATALSLCDPRNLLHLTTDDPAIYSSLGRLTALQRLTIATDVVTDAQFECLLSVDTLREVCVRALMLRRDFAATPCAWRELRVLADASVLSLVSLPLAGISPNSSGIQRCIVQLHISLIAAAEGPAAARFAQRLPALLQAGSLVFEPAIRLDSILGVPNNRLAQESYGLDVDEPGFNVSLYGGGPAETRAVLQLVARHLQGGALVLKHSHLQDPTVLHALRGLSHATHTVCFRYGCLPVNMHSLFTHLPQHVSKVVERDINLNRAYYRRNISSCEAVMMHVE